MQTEVRYSGFKSRNNETYYDRLVFKLIQLLTYQSAKSLELSTNKQNKPNSSSEFEKCEWIKKILKVQKAIRSMELVCKEAVFMSHATQKFIDSLEKKYQDIINYNPTQQFYQYHSGSTDQKIQDQDKYQSKKIIQSSISQIQNNLSLVSENDSTDEILQKFDQKESSRDEIQNPQNFKYYQQQYFLDEHLRENYTSKKFENKRSVSIEPRFSKKLNSPVNNQIFQPKSVLPIKLPSRITTKSQPGGLIYKQRPGNQNDNQSNNGNKQLQVQRVKILSKTRSIPTNIKKKSSEAGFHKYDQKQLTNQIQHDEKICLFQTEAAQKENETVKIQPGERWVRNVATGKWTRASPVAIQQQNIFTFQQRSFDQSQENTAQYHGEISPDKRDQKTPSNFVTTAPPIYNHPQVNVEQQKQEFLNLKNKQFIQIPKKIYKRKAFETLPQIDLTDEGYNYVEHRKEPESSNFIERVDISDGSAQMMGMATGQSFYKLMKSSNNGSPRSKEKQPGKFQDL